MKQLPTQTKFDHNHLCWKCDDATIFGSWDYCPNCEEPHFICKNCSADYYSDGQVKEYPKLQKYSFKEKKELK